MNITDERRMAEAHIKPIRMTLNENQGDFESCDDGWKFGQALCALELDEFFAVSEATVIEVIPKKRPAKNRVKIKAIRNDECSLYIDLERRQMYSRIVTVAKHWIHQGFSYVQIEIVK